MKTHHDKNTLGLRRSRAKKTRAAVAVLFSALVGTPLYAAAGAAATTTEKNYGDLSLQELISEPVTSVSGREQRLGDAAAAIAVVSNEDLRRSGATSMMEALRLVPGLDVGQINSSQWSISSRGFAGQYANKLLVMVDGRAVYTPLLAGVYWDLQQPMLDDVDRIEVIRGPGATVWGANAVNGVISLVSKSAKDTQGGLVYVSGGDVHTTMDGIRYGGQAGKNTYYRIFASYQAADDFMQPSGTSARDNWDSWSGGFRIDHYPTTGTHLTWQGDATSVNLNDGVSDAYNVNTLGRWTSELGDRSNVELQAYYDRTYRNEATRARPTADTLDFSARHTFGVGSQNDVIWGAGYRFVRTKVEATTPAILIRRTGFDVNLFSAFIQDELKLIPNKLTLTAGTKIEHNDFTGFEVQPSVRGVFKPAENHTLWAAVSRAVRTPDMLEDKDVFAVQVAAPIPTPGGPYIPRVVGNANPRSEVLWAYEAGYRVQPTKQVNLDFALFYNEYDRLINFASALGRFVPGTPAGTAEIPLVNIQSGHTYGGEAAITFEPVEHWRLTATYALLREAISGNSLPGAVVTDDPENQASLRSSFDLKRVTIDAQVRYVSQIRGVPAYTTADLRIAFRPTDQLELALVGQNLLEDDHQEATQFFGTTNGQVPRGFYAKLTWRF